MPTALEIVEELTQRFAAGDREGAAALYHPEFRIQQPASLPHGGWHEGQDGLAEMASRFSEYWERTLSNTRLIGGADAVVVMTTQVWRALSTGRSATVDVTEVLQLRDGLIAEIRAFPQDTHLLLETLQPE